MRMQINSQEFHFCNSGVTKFTDVKTKKTCLYKFLMVVMFNVIHNVYD